MQKEDSSPSSLLHSPSSLFRFNLWKSCVFANFGIVLGKVFPRPVLSNKGKENRRIKPLNLSQVREAIDPSLFLASIGHGRIKN